MKDRLQKMMFIFLLGVILGGCGPAEDPDSVSLFAENDITGKGIYVDNEYRDDLAARQGFRRLPIVFQLQEDQETAYFSVRFGGIRLEDNAAQGMRDMTDGETLENGKTVWWHDSGYVDRYYTQVYMGSVYGDVLIKKGGQIVGYAVLELTVRGNGDLEGEVIREVRFLQKDGVDQQITEEEVKRQIEQIILDRAGQIDTVESIDVRPAVKNGAGADASVIADLVCKDASDEIWADTPLSWDNMVNNDSRKITAYSTDPAVEYYVTTDHGELFTKSGDDEVIGDGRLEPAVLRDGDFVFYTPSVIRDQLVTSWDGDATYINVIAKKDGHIIGYAVLELSFPNVENSAYSEARLLAQVEFPQVEGGYQEITEECVWSQIALVKE